MPQLSPRGKWVFGWIQVSPNARIRLPEEAVRRYDMRPGEPVILLRGSQRSGGVAVCPTRLWPQAFGDPTACARAVADAQIGLDMTLSLEDCPGIAPGELLLAVYGSGHALGLLTRGPIYQLAQEHDLPAFALGAHHHRKA